MADASCKIEQKVDQEGNPQPFHVGDIFAVVCEGNFPRLDMQTLELRADEKDKYTFKVFQVEQKSATELHLQATSYMVGDHDLKLAQITDSSNSIVLNGLKFKVESLQDPQAPQKEPFPPMGPLTMFPWIVVILIGIGFAIFMSLVVTELLLIRRRREMMKDIDTRVFQYGALPEFFRNLRQLQREYPFLTDHRAPAELEALRKALVSINADFRIYLARVYRVPTHRWNSARSLRELKKLTSSDHHKDLKLVFFELDKALNPKANLGAMDLDQINRLVRAFVEKDAELQRKAGAAS